MTIYAARQRAIKTNSELQFRSFRRRDARIVNQIQGGGTWDEAIAGTIDGQVSIRPADLARQRSGRARPLYNLTVTIYTGRRGERRTVTWPVVMEHPLPDGARIQEVTVARRVQTARADQWSVSFLMRVPDATPKRSDSAACGIDIGWRRLNDGIRVATIVDEAGTRQFVTLPERIVKGLSYAEELRGDMDRRINTRVATLRSLGWDAAPPSLRDAARSIRTAPKVTAGMLDRLLPEWPDSAWQPEARRDLWRDVRANHRDLREIGGLTARLTAARRDHYLCAANHLTRTYRTIAIEGDLSVADMAQCEDNPTPQAARHYRTITAPGEFMAMLRRAAAKYGAVLIEHRGPSSFVCAECGDRHEPRDRAVLIATCPSCEASWDQDVNAARNILAGALASAPVMQDGPAALAPCDNEQTRETRWQRARRMAAEQASARAMESSHCQNNGV